MSYTIYGCMYACISMPRVGSWQASQNKLIWFTLLCYLLCSGDKMPGFLKVVPGKTEIFFVQFISTRER